MGGGGGTKVKGGVEADVVDVQASAGVKKSNAGSSIEIAKVVQVKEAGEQKEKPQQHGVKKVALSQSLPNKTKKSLRSKKTKQSTVVPQKKGNGDTPVAAKKFSATTTAPTGRYSAPPRLCGDKRRDA